MGARTVRVATLNAYIGYWSILAATGVTQATGAAGEDDLTDIRGWMEATGWEPKGRVLDIGCGNGRVGLMSAEYVGVDVAPAMVEHTRARGFEAYITHSPDDLPAGPFDSVACFSVFTHISYDDRGAYLAAIRERLTGEMLVDILPGFEGGNPGRWYADDDEFRKQLFAYGFEVLATHDWTSRDGALHRYFRVH